MDVRARVSTLLVLLGVAACGCDRKPGRASDTGEVPDCAVGYVTDRGACAPESCGVTQ